MSAPWEVWIGKMPNAFSWVWWHEEPKEYPGSPRYLRADLTCGWCGAFHNDPGKCRHANIFDGDAPACMAFQPKEKEKEKEK